jgi:hypothetical protein
MSEKSMILVQSTWQEAQTFRMIPISESCPYVECIFDPGTKVFVVILKITKTALHMLPKLDEYGLAVTGSKGTKQDRNKIDVFQEFYLEDQAGIIDIIELFAVNAKKFDYKSFMEVKSEEVSDTKTTKK